jgi:hypothetical protein
MADYTAPYAAFKYAVVGITFFNLLAWFLLLGGISSLERVSIYSSRSVLGLPWFILWFQLLLIIAAFVVEFQNRHVPWRGTLNILIAINTVLAIIQTEKFFLYKDTNGSSSRLNATLAGFIILSIFNLLLIILSGSRGALEETYGENKDIGIASYPRTSNVNTAPPVPSGISQRGPAAV